MKKTEKKVIKALDELARLKYLCQAKKHLEDCQMAFCYGLNGEFLAIGAIDQEIKELTKK